jgi:hypothetical protein
MMGLHSAEMKDERLTTATLLLDWRGAAMAAVANRAENKEHRIWN